MEEKYLTAVLLYWMNCISTHSYNHQRGKQVEVVKVNIYITQSPAHFRVKLLVYRGFDFFHPIDKRMDASW